ELQSLSIPGTYQEKITHLGNALMNLAGLKSLDLSRNSLVSLEGIQYLTSLESLNLYYNCISSLAEVFRLHPLTELADVDLRLNPVVKNESDYRLFVVRVLPKLRQLGLQTSVKRLSGEIVELKQHLEHYDKIQELTQMLQESHSSLVGTNEHLLQELGQARAQHRAEVEHMHWSYQELKKTMALHPHSGASRGGCLS
ncbi:centrosomal protein of 72 kDa, partial [Daubentonia madagascariensis]